MEPSEWICSLCECHPGVHIYWIPCPLLEGERICVDCCTNEIREDKAVDDLKALGIDLTREKIDEICRDCGKREVNGRET